jgi:endonuclease/exonuclease/phosphatase family metal-dependent hydrolase
VVSCWNLEHFCKGAERGFPENQAGRYDPPGPTLPPRTEGQLAAIASTIVDRIKASFLVLCEVNGKLGKDEDGDPLPVSEELDELVAKLPPGWRYVVSHSGGEQRIAFLYDSSRCRVNEVIEFEVPHRRIQGSDVFARDPLAAHVTLLQNGAARNDLVIIGLHLASGQEKCKNHDAAMETVLLLLGRAQAEGKLGGNAEHDVLLLGDLNCNMFSPPAERFFLDMDDPAGDWDVLAGDDYPATRLSGSPLGLGSSQIDYIIASRKTAARDGLLGDEITRAEARVHTELLQWKPPDEFRRDLSDHLPVTVEVGVTDDKD